MPTEGKFDSNVITPGTGFMVRLDKQLRSERIDSLKLNFNVDTSSRIKSHMTMLGEASLFSSQGTRHLEKESTKSWSTFVTNGHCPTMILELVIVFTDSMRT